MREIISFIMGAVVGGAATAVYYRRAKAELEKLKQEVESRIRSL